MILDTLRDALQSQATASGGVVLLEAAMNSVQLPSRDAISALMRQSLLLSGDLSVTVTSPIPAATNGALEFNGTTSLLGVTDAALSLHFTAPNDSAADLQMRIDLPEGWTFATSFPAMTGHPMDNLAFASPAFAFTTKATDTCTWLDSRQQSHTIALAQGLNLVSELGLSGALSLIEPLLEAATNNAPIVFSGTIDPSPIVAKKTQIPMVDVAAEMDRKLVGLGPFAFANPRVALRSTPGTDPTATPVPWLFFSVDLAVDGDPFFEIAAAVPQDFSMLSFIASPANPTQFTPERIVRLLAGNDFSSAIPPELKTIFASIGLQAFTLSIAPSGPTIAAIGVAIGSVQSNPWALGPVNVETLTLSYTVLNPRTQNAQSFASFHSTFEMFPSVFPGLFVLEMAKSYERLTIDASYQGTVDLNSLLGEISNGTLSIPNEVATITFSDFGVGFTQGVSGYDWQLYGTSNATFPLPLATGPLTSVFQVIVKSTGGQMDYHLVGGLHIGASAFEATLDLNAAKRQLVATWATSGQPLGFGDIAAAFGFSLPALPENLDLALKDAEIYYDFDLGTVAVSAHSVNYGQILFASLVAPQPSPNAGKRTYIFSLDVPLKVDLSDVPLAGDKLPAGVKLGVDDLQVIIASATLDTTDVTALNKLITDALKDSGLIPKSLSSGLTFATNLEMGGSVQPIILPLTSAKPAAHAEFAASATSTDSSAPAPQGSAKWFNVEKSFGPVQFQRLGVQYQNGTLSFLLDATLSFGPLSLSLMGLGVGSSLTKFSPVFVLQGLGVGYSNPPLQIAGELINLAPPGSSYIEFEGGVTVGTGEFTIEAFGYFGDKSGFPSMFIFGAAASDFGGPPAFFVTGAALGFGYNSNVRMPTIDEVATFPFIKVLPTSAAPDPNALGSNPTPLSVLQTITNSQPPWVSAVKDSLWFAAGITFTSFELVNSQALVIVEAGSELVISLLGTSRAQFPQSGDVVYANIEMDLEARFVPAEGIFSIQAVLAPSSFVIDKACVLTGGFAFYVWYGNNPHSGDFVLTLGGYNPGFTPPSYYPTVPQVGFHWAMDSSITIQGGAYFALTPAALMVGGELSATYQAGNLKAWFNAHADAIIRWKPFWFDVDIGISIGASYKIDLLFTSCTISVEFGCDLEFWGPPTGGTVSVDWYIISFTIPFGSGRDPTQGIKGWSDVEAMLPNTGSDSARNVLSLTPTGGLIPSGTSPGGKTAAAKSNGEGKGKGDGDGDGSPWIVRGSTFGFNTSTHIPATTVKVGDSHTFTGGTFNVHPLQWKGVSALHTVTIVDPHKNDFSGRFEAAPIHNDVPASLWGSPPEAGGKAQVPAGSDQVVPDQIVGVSLQVNPPVVGYSAGPVDVKNFSSDNLNLAGAVLPLSQSAPPQGDVAVNSHDTIGKIANKDSGIASDAVSATRTAIFTGLDSLHYAPETNGPMTDFAAEIGCALSAEPLLVPQKSQ